MLRGVSDALEPPSIRPIVMEGPDAKLRNVVARIQTPPRGNRVQRLGVATCQHQPEGGHWVRFVVTRVSVSREKPHGIDYSLTLHGPDGERLVGFDNAHPVGRQKRGESQDHRHRLRTIRPYDYRDAATLLGDFWTTVDAVLRERGVIP